tara:strand:- start:175 stop:678 length:504 start_codon:yes stop_codon:yes gene_type:complete
MWWHKQKFACCILLFLAVSGCSTVNIGQLDGNVSTKISSISVLETSGRAGQLYSRALRKALNIYGQADTTYELTSSISVSSSSTLSVRGVNSTFKKMSMVANFELTKKGDGGVLLQDAVTADATLGTVSSLFGQDQSELQARDRMATLIAQRVAQRIQLYFLENADN